MHKRDRSVDWLTLQHFWSASSRYKGLLYVSLLVPVSSLGISIVVPYLIGKILGSVARPHADIHGYVYGLVAAGLASVLLNYFSFKALFRLQPRVMKDLQEEALSALLKRGTSYHNNRVSGKLVSDAIDYPSAYNSLSNVILIDLVSFLAVVILGVVLVSLHSLLIGLILFLMAAMAIGSAVRFRRKMTPFRIVRHAANKEVTAHMSDAIVNITTIKTFGHEKEELMRHKTLARVLERARIHDWYLVARDGSHRNFALLLFQTLFVLLVVQEVRLHPDLLATGIFAFSYTITISNRLFQVGSMVRTIEEGLLLAMPTTEMLQETPEILDVPHAGELKVTAGAIDFNDVTFRYTDSTALEHVFKDLTLHIKPGEKIGLVGPSGGGKSTLTRLLLRFDDIQEGSITIDGQNIAEVKQASLRKAIAYVPQEPLLFHRTISENIAYGRPQASTEQIQKAAEQAYAHDFIMQLPQGYDTVVGERGVKLSGGQRQRVAIARAILKDAPILVLDEATAALDSESEVVIQKALDELMQHRTTIVIAHRLSTIQRMDKIIVLNNGSIEEQGSHTGLIADGGLYAKLWKHQSGGFIQE